MNKIKFILLVIVLVCSSCSYRLGDLSVASTKNVDIGSNYILVEKNVKGKSMRPIIIVFPLGHPNLEEAIDDALKKADGDLMTNVVINYSYYYIPYIYGEYVYKVEGDVYKKEENNMSEIFNDIETIYTAEIADDGGINLTKISR